MHHFAAAAAALLGLSALTTAAPAPPSGYSGPNDGEKAFSFPLSNGFPDIDNPSDALTQIELQALGTLPNGGAPPTPHPDSLISLGFIAFNELFEVAFFTELISNITNNVSGFDDVPNRDEVCSTLMDGSTFFP